MVNDTCSQNKTDFKLPSEKYLLVEVAYDDLERPNERTRVYRCPLCDVMEVKPIKDEHWDIFVKARVKEKHITMRADPDWQRLPEPITPDEFTNTVIDIHLDLQEHLAELDELRSVMGLANNREVV